MPFLAFSATAWPNALLDSPRRTHTPSFGACAHGPGFGGGGEFGSARAGVLNANTINKKARFRIFPPSCGRPFWHSMQLRTVGIPSQFLNDPASTKYGKSCKIPTHSPQGSRSCCAWVVRSLSGTHRIAARGLSDPQILVPNLPFNLPL